jgi:hypothetical protein
MASSYELQFGGAQEAVELQKYSKSSVMLVDRGQHPSGGVHIVVSAPAGDVPSWISPVCRGRMAASVMVDDQPAQVWS